MHCKCYTVNADNDLTKGLGDEISLIDDVCISTIRVLNGSKELNKYADKTFLTYLCKRYHYIKVY